MYPQMRHYTIYTGEQRYSPAPVSPPPSPPKSDSIWPTMKGNEPYPYNNSKETLHKSNVVHPSTPNLNYGPYPYNSSRAISHSNHVKQNYYVDHMKTIESWRQHSMINNDINDDNKEEVTEILQTETKKLSRMSIDFMLDNSCDEYENLSSSSSSSTTPEFGKEIDRRVYAGRKRRCRKNPYPMRAPSKDAPGINLKVDVYTPVMKDPAAILRSNDTSAATSPTDSVDSRQFSKNQMSSTTSVPQFSPISLVESNNESDRKSNVSLKIKEKSSGRRRHHKEARVKRSGVIKPERKRKGNSLARVMTDRGLLESIFNTDITSTDIKSVRIPPPPPMRHDELLSVIKELNIDHSILDNYTPDITWKGQPLNIAHLPHYNELHEIEAKVVSILRLTPVQYLTGKHTLVSAARRYVQRALPFKKSDAQKLLRIDVNKASKLWEFFRQVKWI
ncbi:unnamed protein product [Rhizophagus irregularis]|uniref:Uncharacterized protein n=2 Tax=Rhizophagus irregularis TaxID=588596 RepID=A0A2I1E0Q9_9GLOM|nr:hypothetical protein RhiirB3_477603 [Rhizophagus irregularis]CAB4484106.1 unnamed protein product [Rhizophagus irregularis]CAB5395086.1 unnamed protein product [Rhizophagus irregularis]